MNKLRIFLLGILAGISIAFGGAAYIACSYYNNRILGSILFSVGLLLVCGFSFKLYTGQIGKIFDNKKNFLLDLLVMYLGNFVGALVVGLLASLINPNDTFADLVLSVGKSKILDFDGGTIKWYQLLIQSFFCGMLVYFAVEIYNKGKDVVTKVLGLILCVAAFVVSGYAHCVANMYYLGASRLIITNFGNSILSIFIATVGNSIGAIIINLLIRFGMGVKKNEVL